jgi:hypothetical protein
MRKFSVWLALVGVALPSMTHALDLRGDSTTILRLEQQDVPGFAKKDIRPATEFFRADLGNLGNDALSFHIAGWGRVDLADKSTAEGDTDGDLSYAYLLYRTPKANGQVKLGRFFVYEGVAAEQLDGIAARVDLPAGFTVSTYVGTPAWLEKLNNSSDLLVGGRTSYRLPSFLEIGVSALYENNLPTGASPSATGYRGLVGGDISFTPCKTFELRGHTHYNYATGGLAEHGYRASYTPPVKGLTIVAEYNEARFKDLFASSNIKSIFNPDSGDEVRSYGATVTYAVNKAVEASADYKRFNRDSSTPFNAGDSNRYGGELRVSLLDNKSRSGLSYHRSEGDSSFNNSYHEFRGYTMYDDNRFIASADAIGHIYKENINTRGNDFEVIGSVGYKFPIGLVLSGDLSYGQNPRSNDDLRGLLRLAYNFNFNYDKGAKK